MARIFKWKIVLGLALLITIPGTASSWAHPHAFAETYLTIIFDQNGLAAIKVRWRFDEMFSTMMAEDFDQDRDRRFSPDEVKLIQKEAFANLANYGYFTHIWIEDRRFPIKRVRDFNASLHKGRLIYSFTIPCQVTASTAFKYLTISPYDPTFYTDMGFARKNAFLLQGSHDFQVESSIGRSQEITIYYGQVHPFVLRLRFRKRP
ncbi:MAG: DUF1007 family protein [Desulfarculaceae bacterium]|jgi:ABC-type uncharacterized transport system substrate-binding protein